MSLWKTRNFLKSLYKELVSELILHSDWDFLFCPKIGSVFPPFTDSAQHLDFKIVWRISKNHMGNFYGALCVVSTVYVPAECKPRFLRIQRKMCLQKMGKQRSLCTNYVSALCSQTLPLFGGTHHLPTIADYKFYSPNVSALLAITPGAPQSHVFMPPYTSHLSTTSFIVWPLTFSTVALPTLTPSSAP